MTGFLLKCPACGTVYKLPAGAIPERGRKVECSSCNNVWMANAPGPDNMKPAPPAGVQADSGAVRHGTYPAARPADGQADHPDITGTHDLPPLEYRVPADVLQVLREEVEFENRARRKEHDAKSDDVSGENWPATTITQAALEKKQHRAAFVPPLLPDLSTERQIATDIAQPDPSLLSDHHTAAVNIREARPPVIPELPAPPARAKIQRKGSYRLGFGLALSCAAATAALYVYAPELADNSPAEEQVTKILQQVDAGRLWLDKRISALLAEFQGFL